MGFLYVKVIKLEKATTNSYKNRGHAVVLVTVGKKTSSKLSEPRKFRFAKEVIPREQVTVQIRDFCLVSTPVLGELKLDLDAEGLLDGRVHQKWYKFGAGNHQIIPRGYIHLAFRYVDERVPKKKCFAEAPVEKVLTFEEWLMTNDNNTSNSSRERSSTTSASSPSNHLSSSIYDIQSPSTQRRERERERSRSAPNSYADFKTSKEFDPIHDLPKKLIDFSFDAPNEKMSGRDTHAMPQPVPVITPKFATVEDQINFIKNLSRSIESPTTPPINFSEPIEYKPAPDWYQVAADPNAPTFNPKNPFLAVHDNCPPTYSIKN